MNAEDMLARLVAQAELEGGELATLRAIVEEASDMGAVRALSRLGLSDDDAHGDVRELRELLSSWREVRKSAFRAAMGWLMRLLIGLTLIGLTVRLGIEEWPR